MLELYCLNCTTCYVCTGTKPWWTSIDSANCGCQTTAMPLLWEFYKVALCMTCCELISVPESIDCGCCLAGGVKELLLQVHNTGGEGRFTIRHPFKDQVSGHWGGYPGMCSCNALSPLRLTVTDHSLFHLLIFISSPMNLLHFGYVALLAMWCHSTMLCTCIIHVCMCIT